MSSSAIDLNQTAGALLIGLLVASVLFGASIGQTIVYFLSVRGRQDHLLTRLLVSVLLLSNCAHELLIGHVVYHYTISCYGDIKALSHPVPNLIAEVVCSGVIAVLGQSVWALRLWYIRRSVVLALISGALVASELAVTIVYTSLSFHLATFEEMRSLQNLYITIYALAAAGNSFLLVAVGWTIHGSLSGSRRYNRIATHMTLFLVQSGCVTSLCAVGSLVSVLVSPTTFIHFAFDFCVAGVYTNSLLVILNGRETLRAQVPASTPSFGNTALGTRTRTSMASTLSADWLSYDWRGETETSIATSAPPATTARAAALDHI